MRGGKRSGTKRSAQGRFETLKPPPPPPPDPFELWLDVKRHRQEWSDQDRALASIENEIHRLSVRRQAIGDRRRDLRALFTSDAHPDVPAPLPQPDTTGLGPDPILGAVS